MSRNTIIFILLSIAAAVLNYSLYPIISRILPNDQYVDITVGLSLFTQISTFLSSIIAITIGLSKQNKASNQSTITSLQAFLFQIFLLFAFVTLLLSPFIMESVNIPLLFILPILLMMLFSIPVSIISGYLNGLNAMAKLGLVTFLSALLQIIVSVSIAALTKNGLLTMLSMTIAQLITIIVIYKIFSRMGLPKIASSLSAHHRIWTLPNNRRLYVYTGLVALSITAISIIQISDLLIIQHLPEEVVKTYTDVYVISRIVFFAGFIFIWPFLGEIELGAHNKKAYLKLLTILTAIAAVTMVGISLLAEIMLPLIFNTTYSYFNLTTTLLLSVFFKYGMLIVTATILYYVVLHKYIAVYISIFLTLTFLVAASILTLVNDLNLILTVLCSITLLAMVGALTLFACYRPGNNGKIKKL